MTELSFGEALALEGPTLLAWTLVPENDQREMAVISLEGNGAKQIAWTKHPESDVASVTEAYLAEGRVIGQYDDGTEMIWTVNEGDIKVWDTYQLWLWTDGDEVHLFSGRHYSRESIQLIFATASESSTSRELCGQLSGGKVVSLLEESAWWAVHDVTYSRDDLLYESAWTGVVGRLLAAWAGAEFEYRILG